MDVQKLSVEKLSSENYDSWSFKIKMMLVKEDLWEMIDSDPPIPDITPATSSAPAVVKNQKDINEWHKRDGKAMAIIALTVDNSQLVLIKKAKTSKESWKSLKEYHQKGSMTNQATILKKICKLDLSEGGDLEAHLFKLEELFEKLANLGRDLEEDLRIIMVIQSLPDSYNTLTTALEARGDNQLTMAVLKSKLMDEYHKTSSESSVNKALKVSAPAYKHNSPVICNYCKGEGHIKRNCFKLQMKNAGQVSKPENSDNNKDNKNPERSYLCF